MKTWKKLKSYQPDKVYFIWRHRNFDRFFTKIFTWILGGFVAGILTSIILPIIISPELTEILARVIFFVVTLAGILSAFYRNVVNGLEYRITNLGVVHIKPVVGFVSLANTLKSVSKLFADQYETIDWTDVKELRDEKDEFVIVFKHKEPVNIGVTPVAMYVDVEENGTPVVNPSLFDKTDKMHGEALKLLVKKARDAKKNNSV